MAEFLLKEKLLASDDYIIESAGVNALVGKGADKYVVEVLNEHGIDASNHCAKQIDQLLATEFELILPVELGHQRWIEQKFPSSVGRVQRIGRWRDCDIPDPYRRGRKAFDATYDLLNDCVDDWVKRLK